MKSVRRVHAWLGIVFAPSIIFFALSGLFQLNGCHEGEAPSPLIVRMAQIHIHQTPSLPKRRPPRAEPAATAAPAPATAEQRPPAKKDEGPSLSAMKLFFMLMSLALISSSILGLWIALTSKRDQKLNIGLLVAGVLLPVVLLLV